MEVNLQELKFNEQGLIPAIVQDWITGKVLMLAYMDQESLMRTLTTGETWFFSRSRQSLWHKGETSGHIQHVKAITYDCDADALLVEVEQDGVACHTGKESCFHNRLHASPDYVGNSRTVIDELYGVIKYRRATPEEGSYTNYLFEKGIDKILKKVAEESGEVIIAAKNSDKGELTYELSDLIYHSLVLMVEKDITIADLKRELAGRRKKDDDQ